MDDAKTNESELTSTMGNLIASRDEKTETNDSTPTSSTDAFSATSTSQMAADDPISSTSSDTLDVKKFAVPTSNLQQRSICKDSDMLKNLSMGDHSGPIVSEKDLLDMNITDTSTEKITENVDDIVQDLENLLGEGSSLNFDKGSRNSVSGSSNTVADLDKFSAELQMLEEQSNDLKDAFKPISKVREPTLEPVSETVNDTPNTRNEPEEISSAVNQETAATILSEQQNEVDVISSAEASIETTEVGNSDSVADSNDIAEVERKEINIETPPVTEGKYVNEIRGSEVEDVSSTFFKFDNEQEIDVQDAVNTENDTQNSRIEDKTPTEVQESADVKQVNEEEAVQDQNSADEAREITSSAEVVAEFSTIDVREKECESIIPSSTVLDQTQSNKEVQNSTEGTELIGDSSAIINNESAICEATATDINEERCETMEEQVEEKPEGTSTTNEDNEQMEIESKDIHESEKNSGTAETLEILEPVISDTQHEDKVQCSEASDAIQCDEILKNEADNINVESETKSLEHQSVTQISESEVETVCNDTEAESEPMKECEPKLSENESSMVQSEIRVESSQAESAENVENLENECQDDVNLSKTEISDVLSIVQEQSSPKIQDSEVDNENQLDQEKESAPEPSVTTEEVQESSENQSEAEMLPVELKEDPVVSVDLNLPAVDENLTTEIQAPSDITIDIDTKENIACESTNILKENTDVDVAESATAREEPIICKDTASKCETFLQNNINENLNTEIAPISESTGLESKETVACESDLIQENICEDVNSVQAQPTNLEFKQQAIDGTTTNLQLSAETEELKAISVDTPNQPDNSATGVDLSEPSTGGEEDAHVPMEESADLEVLNAISTLTDIKENLNTEAPIAVEVLSQQNELMSEVDNIQDDNLETLLAVASLQSTDYNMPAVEDYSIAAEESAGFTPAEVTESDSSLVADEKMKIEHRRVPDSEKILLPNERTNKIAEPLVSQVETERHIEQPKPHSEEPVSVAPAKPSTESSNKPRDDKNALKQPLVISIDDTEKEKVYSPKVTIKPIKPPEDDETENKGSLKMTITKQADNTHSILKIYEPSDDNSDHHHHHQEEHSVPKLIIKPIQPNSPQSPKMTTRSSKVFSPSSNNQRSASPRITIKPIPKPEDPVAPLKITIKPVLKSDEGHKQKHSPKLTIKPIPKPEEESEGKVHSPRVTIKPVKPPEEMEVVSPRITIKPVVKSPEPVSTPRVTIKPVVKPHEKDKCDVADVEKASPKITIKPIVKPNEEDVQTFENLEESIKERIVLKINKGNIPGSSTELRKRAEEEKSEKPAKIKLKFTKEGGHTKIVQDVPNKRTSENADSDKSKRQRIDSEHFLPAGLTITSINPVHSKLKEMLSKGNTHDAKVVTIEDDDDDVSIVDDRPAKNSPIVISEDSNQDSQNAVIVDMRDPLADIPTFEITPNSVKTINPLKPIQAEIIPVAPAPRKRGRPRKVPLVVREEFKDPKEEEPKPVVFESTRPKRSCRGQSVRTTLGIKPRKPRGGGRGRGGKRGMGTRAIHTTSPTAAPFLAEAATKEPKEEVFLLSDKPDELVDDGDESKSSIARVESSTDRAEIVMFEEETRMSAETNSRAQTPAKQVVTTASTVDLVDESQSSVQSSATTESGKARKGPRLEVHQEVEGTVISPEQLSEYYWGGNGPYMLQEQVAQFLGIKSFKRKYPNIARRVVDMQERDFIRESGLAGEAMCDLGLTAVNSGDILDIMYSDFQDKYEEYCKHQRDRQAKDLINKQRALTLAASQEKAKMDITQQAVQSAASWNATFNKTRRDQRKSCMDLQTLTIHFPKGKMKQINKPKLGYYPVALVPGQFTDYYRDFNPTEINNLPLGTLCYDAIVRGTHQDMECDSQTDGSGSESDSSSSDSDSSYSGSSDAEDCTLCNKSSVKRVPVQ